MNLYNTTWQPSDTPTVLYFTAGWCVPCKRFGPVMEEISKEHSEISFVKVDADEFFEVASFYDVMSLPTIIFLNQGSEMDRMIGQKSRSDVLDWLENNS